MQLGTDSRSYLARARQLLDDGREQFLFYAAYELRCGIEMRLKEYSYAEDEASKKKRQGWRIAEIARGLKKALKFGDKIARLTIIAPERPTVTLYYTPVTKTLRKKGERIGDLMHGNKPGRLWEPGGIERERKYLESMYLDLKTATFGTLLSPPLMNSQGQVNLLTEFPDGPDSALHFKALIVPQTKIVVDVSYHESLPEQS